MLYSEVGFRAIYKKFCCFEMDGVLKDIAKNYLPGFDRANCVLTYGYIDRNTGLSLEILACGIRNGNRHYQFFRPNDLIRTHCRIAAVESLQFWVLDSSARLLELFKSKIDTLNIYTINEEIEKTRNMIILDQFRDTYNIDDILVTFTKKTCKSEVGFVRLERFGELGFTGTLLTALSLPFNLEPNDAVIFKCYQDFVGKTVCVCDCDMQYNHMS